jgi:L-asparagine transporter-like permease
MMLLCTLWLLFNFVDIVVSGLAIQAGAEELGILYRWLGDWNTAVFIKGMLATLVGMYLAGTNRRSLLSGITAGMALICLYNGLVLNQVTGR